VISSLRAFQFGISPSLISRTATEIRINQNLHYLKAAILWTINNPQQNGNFIFPGAFSEKTSSAVYHPLHHHEPKSQYESVR
jgi:hypothetical protein